VRADDDLEGTEHSPAIQGLLQYLSEHSPESIVAVEGTTHVVSYLNPAFARLVGKEKKDLIGHPLAAAVPEGDNNGCLALLDRVFRTGISESLSEQEHLQSQSRPVYWSYSVWAILGADKRPAGVMIQVTDSTDAANFRQQSVAMNEALLVSASRQHELAEVAKTFSARLQAAVQTRDHFIAVLSHELRNPLAAFSSGLHLLKLAGGDPITAESSQEMMERQLKQMVRLVDDLLDVSRITTGKLELHKQPVELASVIQSSLEASRQAIDLGGHELTVTLPPDPILMDADPARLAQAFSNLLNNAAKYSEPGGHIWLSAERDGSEVTIRVRDAGIGISADKLPHIFEVFMQADTSWRRVQGGMGIGLSLVKEFIELHGGRVEAHSDGAGKGSEFIVRLSAQDAVGPVATGVELPTAPAKSREVQRRILVVDDNRDAAESLATMLRLMGHEVRTACDGETGVAIAAEFRPEVILMDLGMPRMDGFEAARRIRSEPWGSGPLLVALTGWGADDDRKRTQEAGFDRHLVKPVAPDALTELMAEIPTKSP
jgi:PAS domain S-box-containing protein